MKIITFLSEREGKNENVWDNGTFSAPRNQALDLFDLSQLRSIWLSFCSDCVKMFYIFYVNHMSEFGVWIKMWRAEVFSRMLVFLWSFLSFLLAMIEYVCLFSKKKCFPLPRLCFENFIKTWLEMDLQQSSTSEQTHISWEFRSAVNKFHNWSLSLWNYSNHQIHFERRLDHCDLGLSQTLR